jgi:hypothetical protein
LQVYGPHHADAVGILELLFIAQAPAPEPVRTAGGAPGGGGGGSKGPKGPDTRPPTKDHPPEGGAGHCGAAQGGKDAGKSGKDAGKGGRGGRRHAGALGGQDPGAEPDYFRIRATRRCWHNGCRELVCDFHLSCRACLRINPSATVCDECHNLNPPGGTCLTLGCPEPGGRPYDPAMDTALANELHDMTPGKHRARRPHFAPKPARTAALGADARELHAAAERFTLASPGGDSGALSGALFLADALAPVAAAYREWSTRETPTTTRLRPGARAAGRKRVGPHHPRTVPGRHRGRVAGGAPTARCGGDPADDTVVKHVIRMLEALTEAVIHEGLRESMMAETRRAVESFELDLVTSDMQGLAVSERGATPTAGSLMMARSVDFHHSCRGCFSANPGATVCGWAPEDEPVTASIGNFVMAVKMRGLK